MKSKKVKGSSLFYAIVLSLLIGLVLTGLISMSYFSNIEFEIHNTPSRLVSNLKNAETILLAQYKNKSEGEWLKVYELDDPTHFQVKPWGLYEVGKVKSVIRKDSLESAMLIGQQWSNDGVAIHLKSGISGLNISGRTKLVGNAAVPGGRIRPSFIENQSYQGDKLIAGNVTEPKRPFPQLQSKIQSKLNSFTPEKLSKVKTHHISELPDSLDNSFMDDTSIYYSADSISLISQKLSGNMIISSGTAVYLSPFSKLKNVIVVAPRIYIAESFEGALQCVSSQNIIIGEKASLTYPSSLVLQGDKTEKIVVNKDALIEGAIILNKGNEAEKGEIVISSFSRLVGQVISNGGVELKGAVYGQVITDEFFLKTGSGFYKNYLLNAEVDISRLPSWFCGLALQNKKSYPKKICDL